MVSMKRNDQTVEHGLVISCGQEDAWCLKQQSVEVGPKNEQTVLLANTLLLAHSIKGYLDHGFGGCFIPALYRKKKPNGVEIGFAYFGTPCPTGIEATEFPPTLLRSALRRWFLHHVPAFLRGTQEKLPTDEHHASPCDRIGPTDQHSTSKGSSCTASC